MSPRTKESPYRYDRAAIRYVLEHEGRDAALQRWPKPVVDPIARVMGLTAQYKNRCEWNPTWTPLLGTKPDSQIAGELNIPQSTVRRQRSKLGIQTHNIHWRRAAINQTLSTISDTELAESIAHLVSKYELPPADLRRERRRRRVTPQDRRGRKIHYDDLSDLRRVAVLAIRKAYPLVTLTQIGEVIGCTRERVRQILYIESASDQQVAS